MTPDVVLAMPLRRVQFIIRQAGLFIKESARK